MFDRLLSATKRAMEAHPAGPTPLVRVPDVGDIVLVYVPAGNKLKYPGPVAKPAIVLSTQTHRDGSISMQVCEGVLNGQGLGQKSDLMLTEPEALRSTGINVPTYFNLRNRKTVMWDESYAAIDKAYPILGKLDPKSFDDMRAAYGAAIRAERARIEIKREEAARQAAHRAPGPMAQTPSQGRSQDAQIPAPRPAAPTGRQLRAMLQER